jgi:hypothetical protein
MDTVGAHRIIADRETVILQPEDVMMGSQFRPTVCVAPTRLSGPHAKEVNSDPAAPGAGIAVALRHTALLHLASRNSVFAIHRFILLLADDEDITASSCSGGD